MPLSFRQAGSLFVAGPNINIYPSGNTFAISGSASGGGGGGVTGLTSAGTGNRLIFSSLTNNNTVLVQKSLSAGTGIAIIDSGTGTLTFSSTSTASGTIISGTNAGTGTAVFSGVVGTNMVFRTLRGGLNANVFLSGTNIVISATSGAINGITALTNVGGGIAVASSVTNNTLISRTLSGANGIEVVESGNLVVVRPSSTLTANRFLIAGTGGALTTSEFFQLEPTVGAMAIGFPTPQTLTNTRLLLPPATSGVTPLTIPVSSTIGYTGARNGDIQYISTGNTLYFFKGSLGSDNIQRLTPFLFRNRNISLTGISNNRVLLANSGGSIYTDNVYFSPLGIFNSITSTTISGLSELTVFNTGGTFLWGTNILNRSNHSSTPQLIFGKKYRFNARGTITTHSSAGDLIARMKLGSVLVASSTTSLHSSIPVGSFFEINMTFTIRSQGASGSVIGSGYMLTDHTNLVASASNIAPIRIITTSGVTINTTNDAAFDFTLQNSTQTDNIYIINEATLEYLN